VRRNYEGYKDAITFCRRAIEKQPDFATAYARMAVYYLQFSFVGPMSPRQFMPDAEAAARRAVALDDALVRGMPCSVPFSSAFIGTGPEARANFDMR
jgi:hypothetical protein